MLKTNKNGWNKQIQLIHIKWRMFDSRDKSFNHEEMEKKNDDQKKIVRFTLNPLDKSVSITEIWSMQRECAARLQNDDKLMYMDVQRVCSACHYISLVVGFQLPRCVVDFTVSRHGGMYTNCIEKMPNKHVTIYPDYIHFGSLLWLAGRVFCL